MGAQKEKQKRTVSLPFMPPRLEERLRYYDLKPPHFAPGFDRVYIMPLNDADQLDTTAGQIVVPDQVKEKLGAQRGLLVAAGAKALTELYSMGIGLGDVVYTMRFSRFVRQYQNREDRKFYQVQIATSGEIMGSEDLHRAFAEGEYEFRLDLDSGEVEIHDREEFRPRNDPAQRDYGV